MRKKYVPKPVPKAVPKDDVYIGAREYLNVHSHAFRQLTVPEQDRFMERCSITICVGVACIMSSFFYFHLPPFVRVSIVPVFIGAAWWAGARLLVRLDTRWVSEQLARCMKVVELRFLFSAIAFAVITYSVAIVPFILL